jgi:hypothetical protein
MLILVNSSYLIRELRIKARYKALLLLSKIPVLE